MTTRKKSAHLTIFLFLCMAVGMQADWPNYPQWWLDGNLAFAQPAPATSAGYPWWAAYQADVPNVARLQQVAATARDYLDVQLAAAGGAGPVINAVIANFTTNDTVLNSGLTLAQLNGVAEAFYDRLLEVGYDTRGMLVARGYPSNWPYDYAWAPVDTGSSTLTTNAHVADVFGFDLANFTMPADVDADWDGLPDIWEVAHNLSPFSFSGNDGPDGDPDNDGLTNAEEYAFGTNPQSSDTNSDGISDYEEYMAGQDANNVDTDGDGLSNAEELAYSTDPLNADTDGDGLSDGLELSYGTDPHVRDTDGDGISDGDEVLWYGTDPLNADTDGDGVNDYYDAYPLDAARQHMLGVKFSVTDLGAGEPLSVNSSGDVLVSGGWFYHNHQFYEVPGGFSWGSVREDGLLSGTQDGTGYEAVWAAGSSTPWVYAPGTGEGEGAGGPEAFDGGYALLEWYPDIEILSGPNLVSVENGLYTYEVWYAADNTTFYADMTWGVNGGWGGEGYAEGQSASSGTWTGGDGTGTGPGGDGASVPAADLDGIMPIYVNTGYPETPWTGGAIQITQGSGFVFAGTYQMGDDTTDTVLLSAAAVDSDSDGINDSWDGQVYVPPPPADNSVDAPATPDNFTVDNTLPEPWLTASTLNLRRLFLAWDPVSLPGETVVYDLMRQRQRLNPYEAPGSWVIVAADLTAPSYTDTLVSTAYHYRYRVRARVAGTAHASTWSDPTPTNFLTPLAPPTISLAADTDGDGLSNAFELAHGTNYAATDSDGDGLPDAWEWAHGLNPLSAAGNDGADGDPDDDGLTNLQEYQHGTDPRNADTNGDGASDGWEIAHGFSPTSSDTDGDGLPNGWELAHGLDPLSAAGDNGALGDPDHDGLPNYLELFWGTNPTSADTDGDGLSDSWELKYGFNPKVHNTSGSQAPGADPDGDGLTNLQEASLGTSPNSVDSDGDLMPDKWEADHGLNPASSANINGASGDLDGDGVPNYAEYMANTDPSNAASHPPLPPAPTNLAATNLRAVYDSGNTLTGFKGGKIDLSWTAATLSGHTLQYEVQRCASGAGVWTRVGIFISGATWTDNYVVPPAADQRYFYRVRAYYNVGNAMIFGPFSNIAPRYAGVMVMTAPAGATVTNGLFDVPLTGDADGDGVDNDTEFTQGLDANNPDTDADGVADNADMSPAGGSNPPPPSSGNTTATLDLPQIEPPHFAVLDLGPGEVVDMNNNGDVLLAQSGYDMDGYVLNITYRLWSGGNVVTLPTYWNGTFAGDFRTTVDQDDQHPSGLIRWARVADDGTVMGTALLDNTGHLDANLYFITAAVPVRWRAGDAAPTVIPVDVSAQFPGTDLYAPYVFRDMYDSAGDAPYFFSRQGAVYFPTYEGIVRWAADNTTVVLAGGGANLLDLPVATRPNANGGTDALLLEFDYNGDTANPDYPDFALRLRVFLNGHEVAGLARAFVDDVEAPFSASNRQGAPLWLANAFEANFAQINGHAVVATPPLYQETVGVADASVNLVVPQTLYWDNNGTIAGEDFHASGGAEIYFSGLTDGGVGLLSDGTLWFNNTSHTNSEVLPKGLLPDNGDASVDFTCMSSAAIVSGQVSTSGQSSYDTLVGVPLWIDPIKRNSFVVSGSVISDPETLPVNYIHNPAVIVRGDAEHPATLEACLGVGNVTFPDGTALDPSKLVWTVESGNATDVVFVGGNHGKAIRVYGASGTDDVRVRFVLTYDDPSLHLNQLNGITVDSPLLRYEALVAPLKPIKMRAQMLNRYESIGPFDNWESIGPDASQMKKIVTTANLYLRQAGIALVWDNNKSNMNLLGDFHSSNLDDNSGSAAIYNDDLKEGQMSNYAKLTNMLPGQYQVDFNHGQKFLTHNYRPGILQVGVVGTLVVSPNVSSGAGGNARFGRTTGIALVDGVSVLDYIASVKDDDNLADLHSMIPVSPVTSKPADGSNGMYISDSYAYDDDNGNPVTANHLYGLLMFPQGTGNVTVLNGEVLAHELGHILSLAHRRGNVNGGLTDGLEAQPASEPGKYLGARGTNFMDYFKLMEQNNNIRSGSNTPEDLDLHQAIIMRANPIFSEYNQGAGH